MTRQSPEPAAAVPRAGRWVRAAAWVIVIAAATAFAWANRRDIPDAWHAARTANPWWLLAGLGWTALYLVGQAGMYAGAWRAVGLQGSMRELLQPSLAGGALNIVSKSAGMGGLAVFLARAKRAGEPAGLVTTAYTGVVVIAHATFTLTLAAVFVVMWLDGHVTRLELLAGAIFGVYVIAQAAVLAGALWSRSAVRRVYRAAGMAAHAGRRLLGREHGVYVPNDEAADELFEAVSALRRAPGRLAGAFAWGMAVELAGAGLLWSVLNALGEPASPVVALSGYAMTVLFSTVGVLPGGLGFAEASLGAMLRSYGVSLPGTAAAVVLFRIGEAWIPLAAGLAALRLSGRERPGAPAPAWIEEGEGS
ncbi:lysylphosphatidylglycerol synthase transmembrane domain-containing protein [Tepidiforma flava]|uniref:Lysylphosphatidylglycerol synthase transmembrane domain-containing protein n=1 Tax=Tepidiforma flava TaxID=3004094 RepID=A0ABY7M8C1_9CHLR|nr:lysylphosphatidylglycerol synthase transmembrane domain-containing protein [Tepidiforma flava]WBL36787.1 lysylphosphatidylglycerol synthase transmembrane domain-containing protein [Tepidiforma flava]